MHANYDNQTVLIIDDQPDNLAVIAEFLEAQGIEIMMSRSGPDGVEKARLGQPDLMPEVDGYETCHRLKNDDLTSDIPVIFICVISSKH